MKRPPGYLGRHLKCYMSRMNSASSLFTFSLSLSLKLPPFQSQKLENSELLSTAAPSLITSNHHILPIPAQYYLSHSITFDYFSQSHSLSLELQQNFSAIVCLFSPDTTGFPFLAIEGCPSLHIFICSSPISYKIQLNSTKNSCSIILHNSKNKVQI